MAGGRARASIDHPTAVTDSRTARWGLPIALLSLLLLARVFAPYAVWTSNANEFKFTFIQLLPYLVDLRLATSLALVAAISWFAPLRVRRIGYALAAALFAIAFIEFHFFVGEKALIGNAADSPALDTSARPLPLLMYASVLVACLAVRRHTTIWKALTLALITFLALQAGTILLDDSARATPPHDVEGPDVDEIVTFSSTTNIIHVILDELQSTFFLEVLDGSFPGARARLRGFTHYRDHLGLHPTTRGSVGYFFADKPWENRIDLDTWRGTGVSGTMFHDLAAAGYRVDAVTYPSYSAIEPSQRIAVSAIPVPWAGGSGAEKRAEAGLLVGVAESRLVPDLLRRWLDDREEPLEEESPRAFSKTQTYLRQRLSSNVAFFDMLIDEARVGGRSPRYKLLHFLTTHNPASLEADCSLSPEFRGGSFDAFVPQTECALQQLFDFFSRLEELGIYDSATIIVHADHGKRMAVNGDRHLERAFYGAVQTPKVYPYVMSQVICSALPLLMIKPSGERGEFRISDAPVWYADIPATVRDVAAIELEPGERSILDVREGESRERHYYYYHYGLRDLFHDRLVKFAVNGPVWRLDSWKLSDEVIWADKDYGLNHIDMGSTEHRYFERQGWMAGRAEGQRAVAYTMGPSASLALSFGEAKPRTLRVHMGSPLPRQAVEVLLDGQSLGRVVLQGSAFATYELAIPSHVTDHLEGLVELEFRPENVRQTWPEGANVQRTEVGVVVDWIQHE